MIKRQQTGQINLPEDLITLNGAYKKRGRSISKIFIPAKFNEEDKAIKKEKLKAQYTCNYF